MRNPECDPLPEPDRRLCRGDITVDTYHAWRRTGVAPTEFLAAPLAATESTAPPWDVSQPSRGFGDTVAKALHWTGLAIVARWLLGTDCGCQSRQARWNRRWPYRPHS